MRSIEEILRDMAVGKLNNVGDVWHKSYCEKGADKIQSLQDQLSKVIAERDKLKNWVNDLQSGMYINCVYCGHQYGPKEDTPIAMADVLKEHIEECPDHPLSVAVALCDNATAKSDRYREALEKIAYQLNKNDGSGEEWLRKRLLECRLGALEALKEKL